MLLKRRTVASYHSSTAIAEGGRAILILCRKRFEDLTGNSETTLRNGVCCFGCHVAFGSWGMGLEFHSEACAILM
jgi:hypothetical protein